MLTFEQILALMESEKQAGKSIDQMMETFRGMGESGKTSLGLNQWDWDDKPNMMDFNRDNQIIDDEIRAIKGTLNTSLKIEKGRWTPVLRGGTTPGSCTYTEQLGWYYRVGDMVKAWFRITVNQVVTAPTGRLEILGAPFQLDPFQSHPALPVSISGSSSINGIRAITGIMSGTVIVLRDVNFQDMKAQEMAAGFSIAGSMDYLKA